MSLRVKENEKMIPRIVSYTINDGVARTTGCVVGTNDKSFSSPGFSSAEDSLSLLDRLFDFRLRVIGVPVGSGRVQERKRSVIAVGRK